MAAGSARSWSARQTRSGVSGRSRMGTPVASRTAAPTAAATHNSAPSLIPFEPYGPGPSPFSMVSLRSSSGQVHARRDPIVDGAEVSDAPRFVEDVVLHEGMAEALDRGAFVLRPDLERVQGLADVRHGDVPDDGDIARPLVYLGLDGRAVELEECGRSAEGMVRLGLFARLAVAGQLSTQAAQAGLQHLQDRQLPVGSLMAPRSTGDVRFGDTMEPGGHRPELRLDRPAAISTELPISTVDRLAEVCWSYGTMAVSPMTTVIASSGVPSSSAAIWARIVRTP